MKRLIYASKETLTVSVEVMGGLSALESFTPVFTLYKKEDGSFSLKFSPAAAGFYEIPTDLTTPEKANYLISCITRDESDNNSTGMHKILKQFIDGKIPPLPCYFKFNVTGDSLDLSPESDLVENKTASAAKR